MSTSGTKQALLGPSWEVIKFAKAHEQVWLDFFYGQVSSVPVPVQTPSPDDQTADESQKEQPTFEVSVTSGSILLRVLEITAKIDKGCYVYGFKGEDRTGLCFNVVQYREVSRGCDHEGRYVYSITPS